MYRVLITLFLSRAVSSEGCNQTECVSLSLCPTLQTLLANPPPSLTQSLNESLCHLENEVKVCCTNTFDVPVSKHKVNRHEDCGYQDSIYEFPWMVSFVGFGFSLCSGALINERYVLTAGSCASTRVVGTPPLVKILLGDYNLKNNHINCSATLTSNNIDECLNVQTYEIEKAIPHPLYQDVFNNIGLIRLDRNVKFNEYIRPICLPSSSHIYAQPGDILKTSGFIINFDTAINMNRLKKNVSTRFIPLQRCKHWLTKLNLSIPLTLYNTCSEDILDVPTFINYFVDHGGPMMKLYDNHWYVESILSLAIDHVDTERPIVNTNVSYYLDWIYDNMEPWD